MGGAEESQASGEDGLTTCDAVSAPGACVVLIDCEFEPTKHKHTNMLRVLTDH